MTGVENCDSDWGREILADFVASGGFAHRENLANAHKRLSDLIASDYDPDDAWHLRCNTLAAFVLIHLELGIPIEPDDLINISIASALEKLPNRECPYWFAQLTFDLALWACGTDTIYLGNVSDSLFQTVKEATKALWDDDFPNRGHVNGNVLGRLFGEGDILELRQLIRTKDLLERLGNAGADEAFYFLSLGFGDGTQCEKWLRRAVAGSWPTSQVAAYHLTCILRSRNRKREWLNQIKSVKFPMDDDPEFEFMSHVALKARFIVSNFRRSKNLVTGGEIHDKWIDNWSSLSIDIADQWDTVRRCCVGIHDLIGAAESSGIKSPICLPELTRSLSVETGRLIEVFLKWSLVKWFPKYPDLDETDHLCTHDADRISRHLGNILGDKSGNDGMTLNELLRESGIQLTTEKNSKHEVGDLIGRKNNALDVWDTDARFPSLVVANAIAAKSHIEHPFRHVVSKTLISAISTFNAAYGVRNESAHYMRAKDAWVTSSEVLYLANEVLSNIDRFMSLGAKLSSMKAV